MIEALVKEIADKTGIPERLVKKVVKALPDVVLERALRGTKTTIPGLVSLYPTSLSGGTPTVKCTVSRVLKQRFKALKSGNSVKTA
jgi:hypothetical protein